MPSTESDDLVGHLGDMGIDCNANGIIVQKIATKRCSSFKIEVPDRLVSKILDPPMWPKGTFVKMFVEKRKHIRAMDRT
jgi:hypothetical protein